MTVRVYLSSDSSAPTLTGQAGSFIAVLDACLVSGYGSATASGWTKPFTTATNIAIYRMPSGNQRYLRIDDTGTTDARIHAFESMASDTDFSAAFTANVFGAVGSATGAALKKSTTADTVQRGWLIIATQSQVYVFIEPTATPTSWAAASTNASGNGQFFFGDFVSYRPNDVYNTALIGSITTTAGGGQLGTISSAISSAASGHVIDRNYLGLGFGGATFNKGVPGYYTGSTAMGSSSTSNPFPDVITGGIMLAQIELAEIIAGSAHIMRGRMPGVWTSISSLPGAHGDTITGTGIVAGKTLFVIQVWNGSIAGRLFIEISNTW